MGLQQILMILLSVIVIGAAISISVLMFDRQANSQHRQLIASELQHYAVAAQGFWRTIRMTGGGGGQLTDNDAPRIAKYIDSKANENEIRTNNGIYTVKVIDATKGNIEITGKSISYPDIKLKAKINLAGEPFSEGLESINIDIFWNGTD